MIPVLLDLGFIKIYSFGLMMGLAFLSANFFFTKEMKRKGISENIASGVVMLAIICGVAGSKLFSLIENWSAFVEDPLGEIFSPSGLTFFGGLILATLSILVFLKIKKISFLKTADAAAPSLILGYGIGRIGCQLAGDGDYGLPTDMPWAMSYAKGTVPTLSAHNAELTNTFKKLFPNKEVPTDILVHPTPLFETLMSLLIFYILWKLRLKPWAVGKLFCLYAVLAGLERFSIEFIRLNELYKGLSQAQWIGLAMILLGTIGFFLIKNEDTLNNKKIKTA